MMNMKESEIPKYLAEELSKEPFNLNLNLISFTSLKGDALMQVFQSVLIHIHPKLQEVFATGTQHEKLKEMMELLRVLKFWPKCFDEYTIREALESINSEIIWDTMGWLLTRREELKTRAYLSQFLVKATIPDEFMLDNEIQQCYDEYEAKIDEFKSIHKKLGDMKMSKGITELVNDLKAVEREVDSCSRKLDTVKVNIQEMPDKEEHLQLASELREARNEKNRLSAQIYTEERKLWCLEKKSYFLTNKVHELQELNSHSCPEGLLERIEQDCEILKFIVHQKIPQDMEEAKRKIRSMQLALSAPPDYASDLEPTRLKIYDIHKQVQKLEMEIKSKDNDASLTFARQKASQNKKKKLEFLEDLEELRRDMLEQQNNLREKREARRRLFPDSIPCLSSRDYKEYVKTMKVKAAKYKSMRQELSTTQAEIAVLTTTKQIAEEEFRTSIQKLKQLEEELGLVGFSCVYERIEQEQSRLENDDESKIRHIYEITEKCRELQEKVKAQKSKVEPLSRGVIDAKQELKALELHKQRLSNAFEAEMGPVTESIRRLEARTKKIKEETIRTQEESCRITAEMPVMTTNLQRAIAEEALLKNNPTSTMSFKNRVLTRIVDQERNQKVLNSEMAELEQFQQFGAKQKEMWTNLKRLMMAKLNLLRSDTAQPNYDNDDAF